MLVTSILFQYLSTSPYFHRHIRRFFADYGMPLSLIASSACAYWGRFNLANPETLPVNRAFTPAGGRQWLVRFWDLDGKWVGVALPFGIILWILFFFDHNVSVSSFTIFPPHLYLTSSHSRSSHKDPISPSENPQDFTLTSSYLA